jgi:hypothetical protein
MSILENICDPDTYSGNSARKLYFDKKFKDVLAREEFKKRFNVAVMNDLRFFSRPRFFSNLERNLHVTDKALTTIFEDLSEEKKEKLFAYAKTLREEKNIEKEGHSLESGKSFSFYAVFTYIIEEMERLDLSGFKRKINKLGRAVKSIFQRIARAFDSVPEARQPELLQLIEDFAEKVQHEPIKPLPKTPAEAKKLGITLYKDLTKEEKNKTGEEILKQNFGYFLKKFTPNLDRDYMCQADLGDVDQPLLARLRQEYKASELNGFLPSKPSLGKQIVKTKTEAQKKEVRRMSKLIERHAEPV